MTLFLNILWATVGGGFLIALQYFLGGLVLCLTIVGIPFGKQCFKLARLSLFPFGKEVMEQETRYGQKKNESLSLVMNVVWLFFGGATTLISHLSLGLMAAASIIGIPFAIQHLKLALLCLFPFGRKITPY